MDFGRDVDISTVHFGLPPEHPGSIKVLGGTKRKDIKVYVGGVLWSDESFTGVIYPAKAKPKDYARYYCRQFNTIELNTTHYRLPEADHIKKWQNDAPETFRFAPKVPQVISHSGDLLQMVDFMNEFGTLVSHFGKRLGYTFLQLPPHFAPKRLQELLEFLDRSALRQLAIEVRHPDWFGEQPALNQLCNYLYKNQMPLVITDTPGRRDVLHGRLTHTVTLIRFNANDRHSTDYSRIDEWVERLNNWFNQGLETVYFFIHTPHQINMPELVSYFIKQLKQVSGIHLQSPKITQPDPSNGMLF
ncbi:MAG: DUF72 domain-containing protein [Sediminibacterium sp.]|nr:DUF72 domain-containing protein [Sediminibacterium sp.]